MIKDNQKRLNRMHVLLDILVTVVAYALAWFIVISGKVLPLDEGVLKPQVYFMALIFIVPIYLILYASFHLYVPNGFRGGVRNWPISARPMSSALCSLRSCFLACEGS